METKNNPPFEIGLVMAGAVLPLVGVITDELTNNQKH
jgi:hypothetical protein